MKQLEIEPKEQTFTWENYTVNLKYNDYNHYWFYDITSDAKSLYGVVLRVNQFSLKNMTYLDMPMFIIIDSEPNNTVPYSIESDLGGRLKLIVLEKEDFS